MNLKNLVSLLALLTLFACSKEAPPESDYANSTTGMVPGAGASVMKDLTQAAAEDMQSAVQAEAVESAAKDVTSVAGDIAQAGKSQAAAATESR